MESLATAQKVHIPNAGTEATCLKCKYFPVILVFVPRPLKVGKKNLI